MSQTQICVCTLPVLGAKRQLLHMQLVTYLEHMASVFSHQVLAEYTHIFVFGSFIIVVYCHFNSKLVQNG